MNMAILPPAPGTVAAYLRVSSRVQRDRETIASQREAVLAHAGGRGWTVPGERVFADDGFSGATLDRPALEALRDAVAGGEVETVVVLSADRLSRGDRRAPYLRPLCARGSQDAWGVAAAGRGRYPATPCGALADRDRRRHSEERGLCGEGGLPEDRRHGQASAPQPHRQAQGGGGSAPDRARRAPSRGMDRVARSGHRRGNRLRPGAAAPGGKSALLAAQNGRSDAAPGTLRVRRVRLHDRAELRQFRQGIPRQAHSLLPMPRHRQLASAARRRLRQSAGPRRRARRRGLEGSARPAREPATRPVRNRPPDRGRQRHRIERSPRGGLARRVVPQSDPNAPPARRLPGGPRDARRVARAERPDTNPATRGPVRTRRPANREAGSSIPACAGHNRRAIPDAHARSRGVPVHR